MPNPKADGNPALRMMGIPRIRARLPSRNWLIFLSITGSFTTAIVYDRNQKKKMLKKWCDSVSYLAREPLPVTQQPRKFTIFLAAPPGDGLRSAREYFQEYVKPVLVAAAVEWDVVEGRREGDVRAGLAEKIRKIRRKNGEKPPVEMEEPEEDLVEAIREKANIRPSSDLEGDLVIGRHTWKEYMRGLQEGWLGPLHPPSEPLPLLPLEAPSSETGLTDTLPENHTDAATASENGNAAPPTDSKSPPTESARKPVTPTPPYISPPQYSSSPIASTTPRTLPPVMVLPFPHILGVVNTPVRTYRFLTQRYLADTVGGIVADMVLAQSTRPWTAELDFASSVDPDSPIASYSSGDNPTSVGADAVAVSTSRWEQQAVYHDEEKEWHKSARKQNAPEDEGKERPWQEDMIVDERIGQRMTTFVNAMTEEETAQRIREEQVLEAAEQQEKSGWVRGVKRWIGWKADEGRVKGWEQGFVGNESE
ncbi:mitochondrial import inner membrane translocase subunit tim54 [Lambiella insularis]|nr:mitochondrial import inner membrane translocase subunit tim54 [Lambiella insularis]